MDNQPDNLMAGGDSAIVQPFSVGAALREARDQLGLSVADVANRIKFAPRQIEALEADDFAHLPEAAFVRGFVRSYARLLEIDATPLLAGLPQTHLQAAAAPENKSVEVPFPSVLSSRRSNIAWLAGGLIVAVVLIVFSRLHDSSPGVQPSVQTRVETLELPVPAIAAVSAPVADVSPVVPAAETPKTIAPAAAAKMQAAQSSDKSAKELAAKKQTAKELAAQEQAAKEQAAKEKIAKRQAALEQAAQEQAAKKQAAKELAAQEQAAKELAAKEKLAKKQAALEQAAQEKAARKQAAQELAAQEKAAKELAAKEKLAKKQAALEQAAQEKAAKKQAAQAQAGQKPGDAASESVSLRLEFDEDSWVDVKDASGKILLSRMNHAGSLVRLSGTAPLSVVIGHASGVHLFYRGKEVDLAPHTSVEVARLLLE